MQNRTPSTNIKDSECTKKELASLRKENAKLKESLRKSQELLSLSGDAAHDLNNLLSALISYPDLLLSRPGLDEKTRKGLSTIGKAGKITADVISDLHTLTRGFDAKSHTVNIARITSTLPEAPEARKLMEEYPLVNFICDLDQWDNDPLTITGSEYHFRKSVFNILKNAFDSKGPENGGHVVELSFAMEEVSEKVPSRFLKVTARDNAPEMEKGQGMHLFEPFFIKKVLRRNISGLTLTAAKFIAENHDGFARAKSTSRGTEVALFFPLQET